MFISENKRGLYYRSKRGVSILVEKHQQKKRINTYQCVFAAVNELQPKLKKGCGRSGGCGVERGDCHHAGCVRMSYRYLYRFLNLAYIPGTGFCTLPNIYTSCTYNPLKNVSPPYNQATQAAGFLRVHLYSPPCLRTRCRKSVSRAILSEMQPTLHATRETPPNGDLR